MNGEGKEAGRTLQRPRHKRAREMELPRSGVQHQRNFSTMAGTCALVNCSSWSVLSCATHS